MPFSAGSYTKTKTFANSGSLLPADLNTIQDDLGNATAANPAFWKTIKITGGQPNISAGTFLMYHQWALIFAPGDPGSALCAIYIDTTDFTVGSLTTKYRLKISLSTNQVSPGSNFNFGLNPVTAWNGASGVNNGISSIGSDVPGSSTTIPNPLANTRTTVYSSEFPINTTGFYAFSVVQGALDADSIPFITCWLQHNAT